MIRDPSGSVCVLPTGRTSISCSARSSLTWTAVGSSPISSRNAVPPPALRSSPTPAVRASVYAPAAWPKSSLSMTEGAIAPQSTGTNGCEARGERM